MKHWILPALCALGIHAILFTLDVEMARPAFSIARNQIMSISLLEAPRTAERREPIAPLPPPRAEIVRPLKRLPMPKPVPDPPLHAVDPVPLTNEADSLRDEAPVAEPAHDAAPQRAAEQLDNTARNRQAFESDEAMVQASVPLYALNPPPAYPAVARRRNHQGTVMLDVLVDAHGRATQVRLARSSGHAALDQSAVESVRGWRFEPARKAGRTIEMWVQVPVRFALE